MLSVLPLLLIDIILSAIGQLLLKKGMLILGPIDFNLKNIFFLLLNIMKNWYIPAAIFCYGLGLLIWLFVLSKIKLSLAYPVTSLVYILVIFGSWLLFKENISGYQFLGTALILIGLFFLFKTI